MLRAPCGFCSGKGLIRSGYGVISAFGWAVEAESREQGGGELVWDKEDWDETKLRSKLRSWRCWTPEVCVWWYKHKNPASDSKTSHIQSDCETV